MSILERISRRGFYYYILLTAIGLSPGGSSPTLVQTKIKIHKTKKITKQLNSYSTRLFENKSFPNLCKLTYVPPINKPPNYIARMRVKYYKHRMGLFKKKNADR
jgi:hypothetical protein